MDGHIRQHQGIYIYTRQLWTWHRHALTPRVLGAERDQEQGDTSRSGSFPVRYTGGNSRAYSFLILSLSLSLSLSHTHTHTHSLSLSHTHTLSLSHTHTQNTVLVTLCFLLESLNPSLRYPDLPENWEVCMVWEYGCFFLLWSKILNFIPWFRK